MGAPIAPIRHARGFPFQFGREVELGLFAKFRRMAQVSKPLPVSLPHPEATQPVKIYWHYALNIALVHALACLALVPWFFSWSGVLLCFLGLYVFGTLGINLCFHRILTHQSLLLPKWLERSLATIAICCLEDSPARWVAIHRIHHQHSDEQPDPHSPLVNLFWGHMGWIVVRSKHHDLTNHYERVLPRRLARPVLLLVRAKAALVLDLRCPRRVVLPRRTGGRLGLDGRCVGRRPIRFELDGLGSLTAHGPGLAHHLVGEFVLARVRLPELRDRRFEPQQLALRLNQQWRRLAQQSPRPSPLRGARP